jgi:pimeloyl-ACP methyl ester carboxylesterase
MAPRTKIAALAAAAAALGAAALFNRGRARAAEDEAPPAGKFVSVDGIRLHYVERGDGRPIVLLHGMGALIQDFGGAGLIDRVAERYRVIAFDRPGYGYSERPGGTRWTPQVQAGLIAAALAKLGIERPIVLGHSWGTLPALALALDFPDMVAGLVLMSGYYFPTPRPDPMLLGAPALPGLGPIIANTASPLLGRALKPVIFRQLFAPMPVPDRFEALFPVELALRPKQLAASAGDAAQLQLGALGLSKRYGELAMPVAIVSGDGDKIVSHQRQAERLRDTIPQAQLVVLPGVGHMVHWVALDEVMDAIDTIGAATVEAPRARLPA